MILKIACITWERLRLSWSNIDNLSQDNFPSDEGTSDSMRTAPPFSHYWSGLNGAVKQNHENNFIFENCLKLPPSSHVCGNECGGRATISFLLQLPLCQHVAGQWGSLGEGKRWICCRNDGWSQKCPHPNPSMCGLGVWSKPQGLAGNLSDPKSQKLSKVLV